MLISPVHTHMFDGVDVLTIMLSSKFGQSSHAKSTTMYNDNAEKRLNATCKLHELKIEVIELFLL